MRLEYGPGMLEMTCVVSAEIPLMAALLTPSTLEMTAQLFGVLVATPSTCSASRSG
jgi:hypothetical protein